MSEALNAETILASFVELRGSIVELRESITESRKDTAELRKSLAEQGERSDKDTAELRKSLAESNAELRKSIAEQGRRIDKLVEEFAETRAELKENNRKLDENNHKLDTNNRKLDENNHRVGDLTNKVGKIVEKIVLPGIVDKFNEKGFKFDSVSANVEFLNEKKNGKLAELDALLENGKFVIAIETKTELTIKDVNTYIKRLQALRKVPRFKGKKIYGAFSTAITEPSSINYALEKGFYVLQQPDTMAIKILDFPKGRSAKAW